MKDDLKQRLRELADDAPRAVSKNRAVPQARRAAAVTMILGVLSSIILVAGIAFAVTDIRSDQRIPPANGNSPHPESVLIPDVVGLEVEEAAAILRDLDLEVMVQQQAHSTSDVVHEQLPVAGTEARAGDRATLVLKDPPHCGAEDLSLRQRWGAATGTYGARLVFTNSSAEPCVLGRQLRALLLDDHGRVLLDSGFDQTSGPQRVVLDSGEEGYIILGWSNWCRSYAGPFRVKIMLPRNKGEFTRDVPGSASCITKGAGTNFSLSNFGRAD